LQKRRSGRHSQSIGSNHGTGYQTDNHVALRTIGAKKEPKSHVRHNARGRSTRRGNLTEFERDDDESIDEENDCSEISKVKDLNPKTSDSDIDSDRDVNMRDLRKKKVEEEFPGEEKIKKIVEEWAEMRSNHHLKKLTTIKSKVVLGNIKGRSYNSSTGIVKYTFWSVQILHKKFLHNNS